MAFSRPIVADKKRTDHPSALSRREISDHIFTESDRRRWLERMMYPQCGPCGKYCDCLSVETDEHGHKYKLCCQCVHRPSKVWCYPLKRVLCIHAPVYNTRAGAWKSTKFTWTSGAAAPGPSASATYGPPVTESTSAESTRTSPEETLRWPASAKPPRPTAKTCTPPEETKGTWTTPGVATSTSAETTWTSPEETLRWPASAKSSRPTVKTCTPPEKTMGTWTTPEDTMGTWTTPDVSTSTSAGSWKAPGNMVSTSRDKLLTCDVCKKLCYCSIFTKDRKGNYLNVCCKCIWVNDFYWTFANKQVQCDHIA